MSGPFGCLTAQIEAFLAHKRSFGYKYVRAELWLRAFDHFAREQSATTPLDQLIQSWLARNSTRKPITVALELGVFRQFCAYLRRQFPKVIVPTRTWAPQSTESQFLPHVLEVSGIKSLLDAVATLDRPRFRRSMYRVLILVLYCTGIRFGEAVRLKLRDLDLTRGVLWVAESKGRSRWVPFHASLGRELHSYLAARRTYAPAGPTDALFPRADGRPLHVKTASETVRSLLRRADLKPSSGRIGPRPYDLRHTFAVHRLVRWYRTGMDVHAKLPWLSAYMGHDGILGTEKYLKATPQLLQLAAQRLKQRLLRRARWP